jgi:Regulator of polyketide synthase expression
MKQDANVQRLLEELQQITGIEFKIASDIANDEESREATLFKLRQLIMSCREKDRREYFLERVLDGEISTTQLNQEAKKYHLDLNAKYHMYYIDICQNHGVEVLETLETLFDQQTSVMIVPMDKLHFVILKKVTGKEEVQETAQILLDMLSADAMLDAKIAYQRDEIQIEAMQEAYKEVRLAMKIGKIFYTQEHMYCYDNLGIGKLIYELPVATCKAYVREIFHGEMPPEIDEEMFITIRTFFENGLNISETARKLYVHRNTLVYRLEKIEKELGLDIRNFEDALTYKLIVMIMDYVRYVETLHI